MNQSRPFDAAPSGGFSGRVTPWRKNRVEAGKTGRHALVMPGIGYTVDRPLLYWATQALAAGGWHVSRLEISLEPQVGFPRAIAALGDAIDAWEEGARAAAGEAGEEPDLLVVAKSLSTLAYPHAASHGIRAALLTPVLVPPDADPAGSARVPVPGDAEYEGAPVREPLVCAGSADSLFDEARARRLSGDVHVYPGANHSIEVPGDWARSIDYLKDVTGQVVRYAAGPRA